MDDLQATYQICGLKNSFSLACNLISWACVGLMFAWCANDAAFPEALWFATHLEESRIALDTTLETRIMLINILWIFGAASLFGLLVTAVNPLSWLRLSKIAMLAATWISLFTFHDRIDDWRTKRQVRESLPKFELLAELLTASWPKSSGEIAPGIVVMVSRDYPDVLFLRNRERFPTYETVGHEITRFPDGVIRFQLAVALDSCVEFHPVGHAPSGFVSGLGYPSAAVVSKTRLNAEWWLVRYGD